jgi:transcriptional regulator with XRE-family HTH domain
VPKQTFGGELRRLRRSVGLSLVELADALGCSIAYISAVERGKKKPLDPKSIKVLLTLMDCMKEYGRMLELASKERQSIEIRVDNKDEDMTNMLVALARKCDEGTLPKEVLAQIRRLIGDQSE